MGIFSKDSFKPKYQYKVVNSEGFSQTVEADYWTSHYGVLVFFAMDPNIKRYERVKGFAINEWSEVTLIGENK